MSNSIEFGNVGQLRKTLEGVPDDTLIACQVVAQDGRAWNMAASFCPRVPHGTIACLQLRHPELKTLPELAAQPCDHAEASYWRNGDVSCRFCAACGQNFDVRTDRPSDQPNE